MKTDQANIIIPGLEDLAELGLITTPSNFLQEAQEAYANSIPQFESHAVEQGRIWGFLANQVVGREVWPND
jgi:hypothetical protein